ncbi:hypothetical protein Vadar_027600 [Vaccinium darrowii]|uniref:Uncharacterized protein n=1 Tax=Vaccinium darrowii TaxID=229202 RepID=A0ACB7XD58_9ERIC|nr:hypothetical protein Vadar_027600 [Vaccinium darrowii]
MFGYKLSKILISKTRPYISGHLLASPAAITAMGVPGELPLLLVGAENSGPAAAVERVLLGLRREREEILEATSLEGESGVTVRVDRFETEPKRPSLVQGDIVGDLANSPSIPNKRKAKTWVKSRELNKGEIRPLNRPKKGSHKSLIADIGCLSHSMFGYKLSKNLITKTRVYISIHLLASPTTITAICAPGALQSLIGAKNSGPGAAAVDRVLLGLRRERGEILEATSLEGEGAVMVRVDPVSEENGESLEGEGAVTVRVDPVRAKEGKSERAVTVRVDPAIEEAGKSLEGERAVTVRVNPVSEEEGKSLDSGRLRESVRILVGLGRVWKERVVRLGEKPEEGG